MGKETDLLHAVKSGDVSYVRKALQKYRASHKHKKSSKKTNINIPDNDGFTILHHAALSGNVEVIMALIEMEADPNARDKKGMCPLHMAAWAGKDQAVKCLLESNALVNLPSFNGETAIHLGSQHGYASVVDYLLRFKADATIRNSSLETPLDLACQYGQTAVVRQLLTNDKVLTMLKGRHDDPRYKSPLHLASKSGHVGIVRLMIESGADVNEETVQGTCLHHASLYGKTEVVRLLLEAGADVNLLNKNNMTPLDIVNKFTTSRAAIEIKQMLREAAGERVVYARALSNYHNIYDNTCLTFKAGDTITVLEQNEDGRWKGSLITDNEEKTGYFPSQLVSIISERRSTASRSSVGSLDSALSNSSDKENRVPKQNAKKTGSNSTAKAVGVVPIGSYEVLTLSTGGSSAQKQKPANIPRMSSFKRTTAPVVQQRSRTSEEAPELGRRRNTEGGSLDKSEVREHRAMTYDVIPTRSRSETSPSAPVTSAAQLLAAVQQAVEGRQEREEGYAVTSPDASQRNYAEVVVARGEPSPSHLQTPTEYTQVFVGNEARRATSSSQSSHSDSSNSPTQSYRRQSSSDAKREEESSEPYEYMKMDQPPPVPAKSSGRTTDEKKKLKNVSRTGYVDMSVKNNNFDDEGSENVPALPKKRAQIISDIPDEEMSQHSSLKRIESRGIRNRQESYENFSPRIVPVAAHNPFSGSLSSPGAETRNAPTTVNSSPVINQGRVQPYENCRPGMEIPPVPLKPVRHSYENVKSPNDIEREDPHGEGEPIPLPPKMQQRPRSNQDIRNSQPQSPGSTDSMAGMLPLVDLSTLTESDMDVLTWLTEQKLSCYFENFQREGFDIIGICGLTPEDLTAVGISKAGHRKKLLSEVTKLDSPAGLPSYKPDDVAIWLSLLHLEHYEDNFIEGGFDDIDFIKDLDRNDLEMIEIRKRGHQRKLLMAVKRLAQLELTASLDKIVEGPLDSAGITPADEHSFEFPPPPSFPSPVPPPPPIDEFDDINPLSQREHLPPPPGAESVAHNQSADFIQTQKETAPVNLPVVKPKEPTPPRSPTSPGIFPIRNSFKNTPQADTMPTSPRPAVAQKPPTSPIAVPPGSSTLPLKPPRSPSMPNRTATLPPPKTKPKPKGIKGQVQTAAEYHGTSKASAAKGMVFIGPSINEGTTEQDVTASKSREFWKQTTDTQEGDSATTRPHRAMSISGVKPIPPAKPPIVFPKPKRRNTESDVRSSYGSSPEGARVAVNGTDTFGSSDSQNIERTEPRTHTKKVPPPAPPRKESILTDNNDTVNDDVFTQPSQIDRTRTISGPLDEKIKATFKTSTSSTSDERIIANSLPPTQERPSLEEDEAVDDHIKETDILMADIDNMIADFSTQLESMF